VGTPKTKAIKARRYRVTADTANGNFHRVYTLSARNKAEAAKLVMGQLTPAKKPMVTCLKTA